MLDKATRRTIYGLLRLARSTNANEAEIALRRARELMDRHGVEVTADEIDEKQITVELTGAWQRDLIKFMAFSYSCKLLQSDARSDAIVVGEVPDVHHAVRSFEMVSVQMVSRCDVAWSRLRPQLLYDEDDFSLSRSLEKLVNSVRSAKLYAIDIEELDAAFLTVLAIEMASKSPDANKYFGNDQRTYAEKLKLLAKKSKVVWDIVCDRALASGKGSRDQKRQQEKQQQTNEKLRRLFFYCFVNAATEEFVKQGTAPVVAAEAKPAESMGEALGKVFQDELIAADEDFKEAKESAGDDKVSLTVDAAMKAGKGIAKSVVWKIETPQIMRESMFAPDLDYTRELLMDDWVPPPVAPSTAPVEKDRTTVIGGGLSWEQIQELAKER